MIIYVTFLRALAALIITNSHYTGIYPTDLIANGGLLGDVIFFAVSGFCLYDIKMPFHKWYAKRLLRIYPAVICITAAYLIFGLYKYSGGGISEFISWFIYPTNYHFVASIIILYIPFYFVALLDKKKHNFLLWSAGIIGIVYLFIYIFIYDKSTYHIDVVREPMIRFLFFESMLLGAFFKKTHTEVVNKNKFYNWILCISVAVIYFTTKIIFVRFNSISQWQILNQIILLILLYFIFRCFSGIDNQLLALPKWINKIIQYISEITLEIYVVQYAIIPRICELGLIFPVNWVLLTLMIIIVAAVLHFIVSIINKQTNRLWSK